MSPDIRHQASDIRHQTTDIRLQTHGTRLKSPVSCLLALTLCPFFIGLVSCLLFPVSCLSLAEAAVSSGRDTHLETGSVNQGGGTSSSASYQQQGSIGQTIGGGRLSSPSFQVAPGSLGAQAALRSATPPSSMALAALYAKTNFQGSEIEQKVWQQDRDPIFYWEPPANGPVILGYSYAVDAAADDKIDTAAQSFDVAASVSKILADGRHTFSVKAINSGGIGGPPSTFDVWIDTTPPSIAAASPAAGSMLAVLTAPVSSNLSDAAGGVDGSSIRLSVNGTQAVVFFNDATGAVTASPDSWIQGTNRIELRVSDSVGNNQTPLIWSVIMDTIPPAGTLAINADAAMTSSVYVALGLSASDLTSGVKSVLISNDSSINFIEEPYVPLRPLWRLNAVRGMQTVYVKFVDGAGNISEPVSDSINLALTSPETLITAGPSGFTGADRATFSFLCPEGGCVFSYAIDHGAWSGWSENGKTATEVMPPGNHYFRVKAAKETNGVSGIQPDEEDPSPAERTWIVGVEPSVLALPKGPPVKVWRIE